jgi:long-subunit acyl-CoA synthetase (AMP-forming)
MLISIQSFDTKQDYITLVHALLKSAIPFALISSHSTLFELTHALSKAGVTHLFVEPSRLPNAKRACKEKRVNQTLKANNIFFIEKGRPDRDDRLSVESLVQAGRKKSARLNGGASDMPTFKATPATRNTLAYLVFSSGTSGLPKGT